MCELHVANKGAPIKMSRRDLVRGLAAGTVVAYTTACATNPETGRSQTIIIDDGSLATMSLQAWDQLKKETPISKDAGANSRLRRVGEKIALASGRTNDPWEFVVFESKEKNAFVLPGGKVGFYTGLLDIAPKDDHVATVLGHEVGHVTGRHAAERYSQTMLATAGLTVAQVAVDPKYRQTAGAVLGLGVQFGVLLPYSRLHELEADKIGVKYMRGAGYDVRESVKFWERMAAEGGARPPEFMSTHPSPETRIAELKSYINTNGWGPV